MAESIVTQLQNSLADLTAKQQYRHLPNLEHQGRYVIINDQKLLNIASNDYLGLGSDAALQSEFFDQLYQSPQAQLPKMSATSSRLLTGNDTQ